MTAAVAGKVFIWAPVAWALVGYSLSGWRVLRKAESDGSDALIFSAVLGLIMVGCCFLLAGNRAEEREVAFRGPGHAPPSATSCCSS